jgi:hypothetical protein
MTLSEEASPDLSGVAKTLLIALHIRAIESPRPDAHVKVERAEAFSWLAQCSKVTG